jgi:Fe2+ or Zn2+ uptake regulation protein
MTVISKQMLKQEIDRLDPQHLELVYKILQQFPHAQAIEKISLRDSVLRYVAPTEPIAVEDWDVLQ